MSHRTTWQETFKENPRYEAIAGVFKLIDKPSALVTDIWAAANKVMIGLNAEERQALPDFVRAELKNREPVRDLSHPSMG